MLVSRPARALRAALISIVALTALALAAGPVAAAPPAAFTLSPASLSFGEVFVNDSSVLSVSLTTARKDVVLDVGTTNGTYTDALTGSCYIDWGYAVPANTTCTIDVRFAPLVAGQVAADLTIDACMKFHTNVNNTTLFTCDRVRASETVSLDGTGLNVP